MKRIVLWNDSNGAAMVLSHLGSDSINSHAVEVRDTTVIYARSHFGTGFLGSGVFNMRGKGGGTGGHTVTFTNILVEDTRPTFANFKIRMEGETNNSYIIYSIYILYKVLENISGNGEGVCVSADPAKAKREPGDLHGVVFRNVTIAARSILGEPEILCGMEDGWIYDLVFDNVVIAGDVITSVEDFYHNEYVFDTIPS